MHVRMVGERRSPGVQNGGDGDLRAEVLGISSNREHGIQRGLEQESVDLGLVLIGDGPDLGGQREDEMEVGNLQQLGLAFLHPGKGLTALTLRAMAIAAAAVRYGGVGALRVLTARDIAAEGRGAAGLDGVHHLPLCVAYVAAVGVTPSGPEVAEDVRDFQSGTLHDGAETTSAGPSCVVVASADQPGS